MESRNIEHTCKICDIRFINHSPNGVVCSKCKDKFRCSICKKLIKDNRIFSKDNINNTYFCVEHKKGNVRKIRNKKHICKKCIKPYYNADSKGKYCEKCIKLSKCLVCGINIGSPDHNFCQRHMNKWKKGKRYEEIYGRDVKCGYQKGENNIAKRPEIKNKITNGLVLAYKEGRKVVNIYHRLKYKNLIGEKFRSTKEVEFSELLIKNNIKYIYEYPVKMINGRTKFVDFKIDDLLIEISGYAHEKWKRGFDEKMKWLRKSVDNQILVISYDDKLEEINKNIIRGNSDIYSMGFSDVDNKINQFINFVKMIKLGQDLIKKEYEEQTTTLEEYK